MDYLEKFNSTFQEFMGDLIRCFPDDIEFKMYQFGLNTLLVSSPNTVIKVFNEDVVKPYETYILAKDDEFFLKHDYTDLKESNGDASQIIEKVKGYYKSMAAEDQLIVMRYMKVMTLLCKKYYA